MKLTRAQKARRQRHERTRLRLFGLTQLGRACDAEAEVKRLRAANVELRAAREALCAQIRVLLSRERAELLALATGLSPDPDLEAGIADLLRGAGIRAPGEGGR